MAIIAKKKESIVPTKSVINPFCAIMCRDFHKSKPVAANIVGTAKRKENSVAVTLSKPDTNPPTIVAAARDTPGTTDKA